MTNTSYTIAGVTITPVGGGFYDLSHPSLGDQPIRERGKEAAEERARSIGAAAAPAEGFMEPQGELEPAVQEPVEDEVEAATFVPKGVPREYAGPMADGMKAGLNKLGIRTTRILLEENPDIPPTGLYLGHNGRGYMIVPGEPVDVPDFLVGVLDLAITSSPVVDNRTKRIIGYRDQRKYPYRLV